MTQTTTAPAIASPRLPAGTPRGSFIVLPGRGDTPSSYERLTNRITVDGYAVLVLDRASDPESLRAVIRDALAELSAPVVLLAADTSAAIAAIALAAPIEGLAGLVIAGAATTDTSTDVATLDDEIALRTACPVHTRVLSSGLSELAFGAGSDTWGARWVAAPAAVQLPSLVIHGGNDSIAALDEVAAATSAWPNRELAVVSGGVHDVLNDVHHRSVAAALVQFAERLRLSAAATPILVVTRD